MSLVVEMRAGLRVSTCVLIFLNIFKVIHWYSLRVCGHTCVIWYCVYVCATRCGYIYVNTSPGFWNHCVGEVEGACVGAHDPIGSARSSKVESWVLRGERWEMRVEFRVESWELISPTKRYQERGYTHNQHYRHTPQHIHNIWMKCGGA